MTLPISLAMSGNQHRALQAHLFPSDNLEAVAFLLCGRCVGDRRVRLLVREVHPIPYDQCSRSTVTVTWDTEALATLLTVALQLAVISELRIGSIVLRDVPIAFAQVPPFAAFDLTDHPALLLGTDLMETFRRISLDFRARKVRFQLRRCASTGMALSTSPTASMATVSASGGAVCRR